jgi:hypothetical protein
VVVQEPAEEFNQQEWIALDPVRLLQEFGVRLGSEHVGRDPRDRFAIERRQPNQLRSGLDELGLRVLHLMQALAGPKCHHPRHRKRREAQRELPHCDRETGPAPVQVIEADKHRILERARLNEGLHVLQEPEQELR